MGFAGWAPGTGDEEVGEKQALCQQEAMAREASAVATRAAEAAAAAARTVAELPSVVLPSLLSFGQYVICKTSTAFNRKMQPY